MSKIGKQPIKIESGVSVKAVDDVVTIVGKNASLEVRVLPWVEVKEADGEIIVSPLSQNKQARSNWGTMRALLQNAVSGVSGDFSKELIIEGVGYRAEVSGKTLNLNLGYSHPIKFDIPDGIKMEVAKNTLKIFGADKSLVGQVAAKIRSFRKPEPYNGKGIRYNNEVIRRKAGKKAAGSAAK
ncbi:MAG: 50S ribosomal protein L6 [Patescibacteria group bacterium]|nr:50S ribosomal protein L6 [Patescibacteria group bacterium]